MSMKLKNTERHLLTNSNDQEKKILKAIDKMESKEDEASTWLIDTEIVEINKLLWKRKR